MGAVITILAFLHIAAAVGWMGAVVFFLSAIGPGVRTFTPAASLEFLTKVGPRQIRFFVATATGTIVFGIALQFEYFGSSGWPTSIEVGFVLGLIAYLIAIGVTVPSFRNADKVAHKIMSSQGPPPPELGAQLAGYMKRANIAAISVAILLLLTLAFMVYTGFPF
jgi:hypothetical protein